MFRIESKDKLSPEVVRMRVSAPRIARRRQPGQFVVVMPNPQSERIPLTICDADALAGTITLIFQVVGGSTQDLAQLEVGQDISHIAGPLGRPTHVRKVGWVCGVGGGVGIALLYPIAKGFADAGNRLTVILGARTKELLILQDEMSAIAQEVLVCTDDGSLGRKAMVSVLVEEVLSRPQKPDEFVVVGPARMMQAVSRQTQPFGIPTVVSLNPIMVDGTGMCGGCRVTVGGQTRFACVDGPEFDGHLVDFEELIQRQNYYRQEESAARRPDPDCHLTDAIEKGRGGDH